MRHDLPMDDFSGKRVRVRLLTDGYAQSYERFEVAEGDDNPIAAFFALFEALNWAHAVDDLIAKTWSPRGKVVGYDWRTDPAIRGAGAELSNIMQGLRYVRNRVHHQWADALVTDKATSGLTFPMTFPATFGPVSSWAWRSADDLPTPSNEAKEAPGREAYTTALAGRKPDDALEALRMTFPLVAEFLDPPMARRTAPIVTSATD
jgi:hypothetical protein